MDPSDATKFKVELSALSNGTMFDIIIDGNLLQSFIATEKWDHLYHQVTVNGKLEEACKSVSNTSISIDESVLAVGDIIDLRWNNNDLTNKTTNTSMPDIHEHNVHNKMMETFTLSETMDHWSDKLNTMHGFDGNTFDENNYASIPTCVHGGTIFMYEDGSIMNDINYSNNKLSITGSLSEQANEFVAFRNRVAAQARRVYGVDGATSIQELTNKVIDNVTRNRFDTAPLDSSKLGVYYSPQTMINDDIIAQLGFTILDDLIGDPRAKENRYSYPDLINTARDYWKKYATNNDMNSYLRIFSLIWNCLELRSSTQEISPILYLI